MTPSKPTLLVLGSQGCGKSTYRAQVYQRAEHSEGALQISKSTGNTGSLDADVARLNQGLQPLHTRSDDYQSAALQLKDQKGHHFVLEFADYGGEQIKNIGNTNSISTIWMNRAQSSGAWLFFLRIDKMRLRKDFMTSPLAAIASGASDTAPIEAENTLEIAAIETLQRLLFARESSVRHKLESPCLGVLLSCWDELSEIEQAQPIDQILKLRAPLFYQYVRSTWKDASVRFWALSSTEKRLPESEPDMDFVMKGPENFGFVIGEDGHRNPDLTTPIEWLLESRGTWN